MSVTPNLECLEFPNSFQYVLVASGQTKELFYLPINGGYVGFIDRIACDWFENTVLEFIIDGIPKRIEYEIQINKPYVYEPPLVARRFIRWRAINNDTKDHYFGILCDGRLCKQKT